MRTCIRRAKGYAVTTTANLAIDDTGPKLLLWNAEVRGDRPAIREKYLGIWQTYSWSEVAAEVQSIAGGLKALGLERGDRISIVGDNRPRLYWSIIAAQALGAVPVPMYQDAVAEEMQYVLEHAESRFVICENQEQVDKVLQIKDRCPKVETVIYDDDRGMRDYKEQFLHNYDSIISSGREYNSANPDFYLAEIGKGKASDTSIMLYTSGTTGRAKGVVLTYENILLTAYNAVQFEGLKETDEIMAYLPMAWVGDHTFSYGQALITGFCTACPESADTVLIDIRELGPTYFFAPPRIFENLLTSVMIRIEDASTLKQKMFHYFMQLAQSVGPRLLDREPVGLTDRLMYALGNLLVYAPLKNVLGFSKVRLAYTAGEAIGPDIFNFYRSIGLNLKQLYGMTESSVFVTIQPNNEIRMDTVGRPIKDVEVRIEDSGEVLFKSPGIFREYYKNPEATAETKTDDGWCRTGDAGFFDDEGHLRIIDRAKDVGKLDDNSMFAPKYIENKLKFFPDIYEAVTFGDAREYVSAFINIDLNAMGNWAERNGVSYASYQDLTNLPQVHKIISEHIQKVNADLANDPRLAGSQIKRFLVLHKQLDADDGELTRTQKVRRRTVAEKYGVLIDALYSEATHCEIETEVTFEDGRKGSVKADLQIIDVEPASATILQAAE
jgi:long-chain acyl-CoA synthetase